MLRSTWLPRAMLMLGLAAATWPAWRLVQGDAVLDYEALLQLRCSSVAADAASSAASAPRRQPTRTTAGPG